MRKTPTVGMTVSTCMVSGEVIAINPDLGTFTVRLDADGSVVDVKYQDVAGVTRTADGEKLAPGAKGQGAK